MPPTLWAPSTILWFDKLIKDLDGSTLTTEWVKAHMDEFYSNCGQDPLLLKPGYQSKTDVQQRVYRYLYNKIHRLNNPQPASTAEITPVIPKSTQHVKRVNSRDIYIQTHKGKITDQMKSNGDSGVGKFQDYVTMGMGELNDEELAELATQAEKINNDRCKPFEEHDPISLQVDYMAATLQQEIDHWAARTGLLSKGAQSYKNTETFMNACNEFACWMATSHSVKVANLLCSPKVFPDWMNKGFPRLPSGNFDDQPETQQKLNRDFMNAIWRLQGGNKSTPWKCLQQDSDFIKPSCWPDGVSRKDPSHLTKLENSLLFKYLQKSSMNQMDPASQFQFNKVVNSEGVTLACPNAYTQCNPKELDSFWTPAHYRFRDQLHAQLEQKAVELSCPKTQREWLEFPLPTSQEPPLFPRQLQDLASSVCKLTAWHTLLELAWEYQKYFPVEGTDFIWMNGPIPSCILQAPPRSWEEVISLLDSPWMPEAFFNPTASVSSLTDGLPFLLQWCKQSPWTHPPSACCLGGLTGVINVVLGLGKVTHNLEIAFQPHMIETPSVPTYVTPDYLPAKSLHHIEDIITSLSTQLQSSITFATKNLPARIEAYVDWQDRKNFIITELYSNCEDMVETTTDAADATEPHWGPSKNVPVESTDALLGGNGLETTQDFLHEEEILPNTNEEAIADTKNTECTETSQDANINKGSPIYLAQSDTPTQLTMPDLDSWLSPNKDLPLEFASKLQLLKDLAEIFPKTVKEGQPNDYLAVFGGSPFEFCPGLEGNALWEEADPILNRLLGGDISAKELGTQLTMGRYGVVGLHNTFLVLVSHRGIEFGLLEGKLDRVLQAVRTRFRRTGLPDLTQARNKLEEIWKRGADEALPESVEKDRTAALGDNKRKGSKSGQKSGASRRSTRKKDEAL